MKKTTNLNLPVYDTPSVDTFKLDDWNSANETIDYVFGEFKNGATNNAIDITARQGIIDVNSQLADNATDVSYYGSKGDNATDDTNAIQNALDKCGMVTIKKAGIYKTKTLKIGSNTHLKLGDGVTLKLMDNTSNYLIVNKGELAPTKYRDKNIKIEGGTFDFSGMTNPQTGGYRDGLFGGHGVLLHGVDNLEICNIAEVGHSAKYAFLIADVTNVKIYNCHVINGSDGFHFQPPLKNIHLHNLTGVCDDNFIAFTTGDYTAFTVSEDGNGENILIENIYVGTAESPTNGPIRFVGSGKSNVGFYDNIEIRNVVAYVTTLNPTIEFMNSDTWYDGNIYLRSTHIKNIKISNVKVMNYTPKPIFGTNCSIENMIVENMTITPSLTPVLFSTNFSPVNLHLKDFICRDYSSLTLANPMFTFGYTDNIFQVKKLTLENFYFEMQVANDYTLIKSINSAIENLNIVNCKISFMGSKGYLLDYSGVGSLTYPSNIFISNSEIVLMKNKIENMANMYIGNSKISLAGNILAYLNCKGKLRLVVNGSDFVYLINGIISPAVFSVNGTSASCANGNLACITSQSGDIFSLAYGTSTTTGEAGVYVCHATSKYRLNETVV